VEQLLDFAVGGAVLGVLLKLFLNQRTANKTIIDQGKTVGRLNQRRAEEAAALEAKVKDLDKQIKEIKDVDEDPDGAVDRLRDEFGTG
jgi:hypothetical protein